MVGMVHGKVALVTGAGSGIGRKSAELLAQEGARVLVCDLDEQSGQQTLRRIRDAGGEADFWRVDVAQESEVETMVAHCVEHFGRLDCAVNNAGISGPSGGLETIELPDWNRVLAVNLTGVFLCMKHELLRMREQKAGSIVNMSSGAGLIATPGLAPYSASKHGVLGITRAAAVENARQGIRINAVCPGSIDTPMLRAAMDTDSAVEKMIRASMPIGRLGEAEEVAEAVVWLCSDRASLVTGHSMGVDGASVAR
ncbi:MAG TPA: SDR family oxidoreductase [Myxococcales bacterium]|nr:SDR family oxidoreductase [Myxococcales bacterium]